MHEELARIEQWIQGLLEGKTVTALVVDQFSTGIQPLVAQLKQLVKFVNQMQEFSLHLANGELHQDSDRSNLLLGPLKDLQSNLQHMLWQVNCVSKGDYSQNVDFLGEFSVMFNALTDQIRLREALLQQQAEQRTAYYLRMQILYEQMRTFRHDIKNHCLSLAELISAGMLEDALAYINSVAGVALSADGLVVTGNPLFDAILSEKISLAREKGIEVDLQIVMPKEVQVNNFDWCVLLGNSWDNAVEACLRLPDQEKKRIWFNVKYQKGMLNIALANTALEPENKSGGFYKTSKVNAENHGIGLKNMTVTAEQYDGVLNTTYKDGVFTLTFMLCGV